MKTANKILLIAFGLVCIAIIAILVNLRVELSKPVIAGSGRIVEVERELSAFESISIRGPIQVSIHQNGAHAISINTDDNIAELVETKVRNRRLQITLSEPVQRDTRIDVTLSVDHISALNASAGAQIRTAQPLRGNTIAHILSSGANSKMELYFDEMKLEVKAGASTVLQGKVDVLDAKSSSGANINAKELEVYACHITGSSGAQSSFFVNGQLHANAKSGAVVSYTGNPDVKVYRTSGGGTIVAF